MGIEDVCRKVSEREARGELCRHVFVPGEDGASSFNWITYRVAYRHLCPGQQIRVGTAFMFFSGDCLVVDEGGQLTETPYRVEWSAPSLFMTDEDFVKRVTEGGA